MTERVERLRQQSFNAQVSLSTERARLITEFYRENIGRHSAPVMRAKAFEHLCRHKTLWIGAEELVVGERGPRPKAVPTYPELTCHSEEDLRVLASRPKTRYLAGAEDIRVYKEQVIPFWHGRTMREKIFQRLPDDWKAAYAAGARAHHLRRQVLLEKDS